jgi:hypothetical protein
MKLCIHCVHFLDHPESKDPKYGLCEASPKTYSPVTGAIERDHEFCSSYRISTCGMKARFFVPILGLEPDHEVVNETPDSKVFPITVHTAPKREWVGLTDEEIQTTWDSVMYGAVFKRMEVYKAIEAKLKEKNT